MNVVGRIRRPRAVLAGTAVLAVVALVVVGNVSGEEAPERHITRVTDASGLRAYAELLRSYDAEVRVRTGSGDFAPDRTIVVLEPRTLDAEAVDAVTRFVDRGGRLVVIGGDTSLSGRLLERPPVAFGPPADELRVVAPVPESSGVATVAAAGATFAGTGEALPVIAADDGTMLAVADRGRGRVVLLASADPLRNGNLATADHAALGLAVVGGPGRDVTFLERGAPARGLAAIPTKWKWTLGLLLAASLVLVLAQGRRMGPPDRPARALAPPRRGYVESMGRLIGRARRPDDAVAPLRARARELLWPGGQPAGDTMAQAAARGLTPAEARALFVRAESEDDLLLAGRAFARLERHGKGRE